MEKYQKIKNFNIPSNIIKVVNWKTGGFIETPLPKCFWCEIHWRFFTVYKCRRSGSALEFGYGFTHQGQTWHGFSWLIDCPSSSFLLFISGMWARLNLVWPFPTCDWSPCDKISDPAVGIFRIIGSNLQNPRSQYRSNVVQHPIQWGKLMCHWLRFHEISLSLSLQNDIPNLHFFSAITFSCGRPRRRKLLRRFARGKDLPNRFIGSIPQCQTNGGRNGVKENVPRPWESRHMPERINWRLPFTKRWAQNTNSVNDEKFHFQQHFFFAFLLNRFGWR